MLKYIIILKPFLILFFSVSSICYSQKIATLEVELARETYGLVIPVSINLDPVTFIPDSLINLLEIEGDKRTEIPFQIKQEGSRKLYWMIKTKTRAPGKHIFELVKEKPAQTIVVAANINDSALTIHKGDQNLLQYYFKTVYPPKGIDTVFRRSGFIHPLWSPHGQILTRIQPPDHYHHYGIWNPWTHVLYEGDTINFQDLKLNQGTVRFANFVTIENGSVFSEFDALHEHVIFKKDGGDKVAMNELQSVRVFPPQDDQDFFIVDFDIKLNSTSMDPIKIMQYRYAGFGWRATQKWNRNNSMVLTSEGKTRKDSDGSKARWCIVQGEIDNDYAGVVMMSFPTNYNYPEPLRIWPEDMNNRGDMYANFCPVKDMDWILMPRQNYSLKYRLLVFNGQVDKKKAECAWQYFAYPPKVTIKTEL